MIQQYQDILKVKLTKTNEVIIKVAAIVAAITAIAGGYTFYINNIWKPKVQITEVDFEQGLLQFTFEGKTYEIFGDTNFYLGGDWSIRLGSINLSGGSKYDTIQLSKRGAVVEYLNK
jgi:hypothetical protein